MPTYRNIGIGELTPGSVLVTPVFDDHLAKLLDAGAIVDQSLIDRLQLLGITEVVVEDSVEHIVNLPRKVLPEGVHVEPEGVSATIRLVERCSVCGRTIALQGPSPDSKAVSWLCKTCGAVYFGSEDGRSKSHGVRRNQTGGDNSFVAPVAIKVDANTPATPPENIQRLVRSMASEEQKGADRRRHKRHPVMLPVAALPLANDFRVDGEPMQMTTANVSLGGAALIHTRCVDAPFLALDFSVAGVELLQVVLKVLRVSSRGLVYEIGGEFISRLSQSPSD